MTTTQKLLDFSNLAFHTHPSCSNAIMAQLSFGDFTISVVQNIGDGTGLYGHARDGNYEVAMFFKDSYVPLAVSDDVLAGQTPAQVSIHMRDAQLNGFAWVDLLKKLRADFRSELGLDN